MDEVSPLSATVLAAVRRVLKPVMRLLLSHGVTLPAIVELTKRVLVEVAEQDFALPGKPTTDSRVSVLTGVHRKDVKRIREHPAGRTAVPLAVSLGSRLVGAWLSDPRWLDPAGHPRLLPRSGDGGGASFDALAETVSKDVRPRAILDELLRVGAVTLENDSVRLRTEAFVPSEGVEEKLYYLSRAVYSHLSAAVHNTQGGQPAFLDRIVHYDTIPPAAVQALRDAVEQVGMRSLLDINARARQVSGYDGPDRQHITCGLYFFSEAADVAEDGG